MILKTCLIFYQEHLGATTHVGPHFFQYMSRYISSYPGQTYKINIFQNLVNYVSSEIYPNLYFWWLQVYLLVALQMYSPESLLSTPQISKVTKPKSDIVFNREDWGKGFPSNVHSMLISGSLAGVIEHCQCTESPSTRSSSSYFIIINIHLPKH